MTRVAILEDDLLASIALRDLLEAEGIAVQSYASTDAAFTECCVMPPDVLIADWCVPGDLSVQQLVECLRAINPALQVILTSGYEAEELRELTSDHRWISYLAKPIPFDLLVEDIKGMQDRPAQQMM